MIAEAIEAVEPQLRTKRHRLSTLAESYEPLYINGDHARLVQCLANVLTNAVKYTDAEGDIRVQTRGVDDSVVIEATGASSRYCARGRRDRRELNPAKVPLSSENGTPRSSIQR